MDRGELESLGTKTSKNVHDVRKLVLEGTSVRKYIWRAFRSWKSMKLGWKVYNMS